MRSARLASSLIVGLSAATLFGCSGSGASSSTSVATRAQAPSTESSFSSAVYPPPVKPVHRGGLPYGCPNPRGVEGLAPDARHGALQALRSVTGKHRHDRRVADRAYWPALKDWRHSLAHVNPDPGSGPARTSPYRSIARSKCGYRVVRRSWSFVLGPRDPGLQSTVFLLQRRGHWLLWFEYP